MLCDLSSLLIQYEESPLFKPNKSFLNSLTSIPIGVTTKKKTKPITIGDIIFPSKNPNLTHNLFKNVNKLGLIMVIIKNTKDTITGHILIGSFDIKG